MGTPDINAYQTLGVGRSVSQEEVKKAFRKLARESHPDKNPNDPTAKERFQDIQRAYDMIKDEASRKDYNEKNPYHGYPFNDTPTARSASAKQSATASRYTKSASGYTTHHHHTTPGWAGTPTGVRPDQGFAHQSSRARPYTNPYASGGYGHSGRSFGFESTSGPRANGAEYDEYAHMPRAAESAYARTRPRAGTPSSGHRKPETHSSSSSKYTEEPGDPGFDLKSYIREKQREKEQEWRRQQEKTAEETRLAEEKRAREEMRKAEEAERVRRRHDPYHNDYEDYNYSYASHSKARHDESNKDYPPEEVPSSTKRVGKDAIPKKKPSSTFGKTRARPASPPKASPIIEVASPEDEDSDHRRHDEYFPPNNSYNARPKEAQKSKQKEHTKAYPFSFNMDSAFAQPKGETEHIHVQDATPPQSPAGKPQKSTPPKTRSKRASSAAERNKKYDPFKYQEVPTPGEFASFTGPFGNTAKTFTSGSDSSKHDHFSNARFGNQTARPHSAQPFMSPGGKSSSSRSSAKEPNSGGGDGAEGGGDFRPKSSDFNKDKPTQFKELYHNLANLNPFEPKPELNSTGGSPKKKRSAPVLNGKVKNRGPWSRTSSVEGNVGPRPKETKPASEPSRPPPPSSTTEPEPMDLEPDAPAAARSSSVLNGDVPVNGTGPTKKSSAFDFSDMNVPPLKPSPGQHGLGGFEELRANLPFPSQASDKPPLGKDGASTPRPKSKSPAPEIPETADLLPVDPTEGRNFTIPRPPQCPDIPNKVSLKSYNKGFGALGPYFTAWNEYEDEVQKLRAELVTGQVTEPLDGERVKKYLERVKKKDCALDEAYTAAKMRHLKKLDMWMEIRKQVIETAKTTKDDAD